MPLEKQTVSFPFAKGLSNKGSDKTREHDSLETARNVYFEKTGQLRKRTGFDQQGNTKVGGGTISKGVAIAQYKDETLVLDGSKMYSKVSTGEWIDRGTYLPNEFKNEFVLRKPDRRQSNADMVEAGIARVYVWTEYVFGESSYIIKARVEDLTTGVVLRNDVQIDSIAVKTSNETAGLYDIPRAQCIVLGNRAYIVWQEFDSTRKIVYNSIDCTSHTTVNSYTVGKSQLNSAELDNVHPIFLIDRAVNAVHDEAMLVVWKDAAAAQAVTFQYFTDSSGTLSADTTNGPLTIDDGTGGGELDTFTRSWDKANTIANDFFLKCLNDEQSSGDYQIVFGCTHEVSSNPEVRFLTIKDTLVAPVVSDQVLANTHLISGTAGTESNGGTIHIWVETSPATGGVGEDTVSTHRVSRFTLGRGTTTVTAAKNPVAFNSSITSDAFRYNGKLYVSLSHVNDVSLTTRSVDGDNSRRGLNNNIVVMSSDDELVSAARTGLTANCLTSEWVQRSPVPVGSTYEIRRLGFGVRRVVSKDSGSRFIFGAARFAGYAEYDAGSGSYSNYRDNVFGISLVTVDFDPPRHLAYQDVDGTFVGTGGFMHGYDGSTIFEQGFVAYPAIKSVAEGTATSAGDGLPTGGELKYIVIYEWADANGNIHRSAPSLFAAHTPTGASKKLTLNIYPPNFSRKVSGIKAVVYRTQTDKDIYYKLGSKNVSLFAGETVSFVDDAKNFELTDNDPPYSTTELSNGFIGSCTDIARHRSRIFAVSADDVVHYSKPLRDGSEVRFPDEFVAVLPGDNAKVTAIESNMDHFLIFTEDNGHYLSGEGPSAIGQGGFTTPRIFAVGQGAKRGSGHIETPVGVFYHSERGIYLIGRDMSVKYIGAQVEDHGSRLMVGASLSDSTNEVRFVLSNKGSTSGPDQYLIYNYYFGQWTDWTINYTSSAWQLGEVWDGSNYIRLTADGKTFKQTAGLFQDDNTAGSAADYTVGITTAFIAPGGLFQAHRIYRVLLVGGYISDHTMIVGTRYDYSSTAVTTFSKAITSANNNPYLLRAHLDQQKCRAIQLKITITASGECLKMDGLAFEVGRKKSTFKAEAARTL